MRMSLCEAPWKSWRFLRREDGSATVEAVLWIPIFMVVFALMLDSAMIYNGQAKVLRVIQDANRKASLHSFQNDNDAAKAYVESFITTKLGTFGVTPNKVVSTIDDNVVLTLVQVPAGDLQPFGYFSALLNLDIDISSAHIRDTVDFDELSGGVTTTY